MNYIKVLLNKIFCEHNWKEKSYTDHYYSEGKYKYTSYLFICTKCLKRKILEN